MTHNNYECTGPSLHNSIALTLASALDSLGLDSQKVFSANNVDQAELRQSSSRIPQNVLQCLWRDGARLNSNDDLGIQFVERLHPASMHGLWICCATSDTLLAALQRLVRYYRVVSTFSRIHISESDAEFTLHLALPASAPIPVYESIDAELSMLIHLCRFAQGNNLSALRVELQRPAPKSINKFVAYFRSPITFNADKNCLIFDKHLLRQALPASNPAIVHVNEQLLIDYLRVFDEKNIVNRVKSFIIEALPNGIPTQKKIGELMNNSTRTLKRKLAAKGTNYAELLESTQRELATNYLCNTARPIGEISNLLGYTEPSNFTRSFKKWTQITPVEYRECKEREKQ